MSFRGVPAVLILFLGCALTGCENFAGWGATPETDLTGLDELQSTLEAAVAPTDGSEPPVTKQTLQLNLKVGDRFPLRKTVVQTLTQYRQKEVSSTSSLEMMLSITVDQIPDSGERKGQKRMMVKYHRVRFSQDLAGKQIAYDSRQPPAAVPPEAQGYHGLVDNGFFFWLGPDNQIVELAGFEEFVGRCLKHVAPERQQQVRTALLGSTGAEGIANFVDDSIGLLPAHAVKVGDVWASKRKVQQPLPMFLDTEYTLRDINPTAAEIIILGTITPMPDHEHAEPATRNVQVTVRSGRCQGFCMLDRRTGLPTSSQVEQTLDMKVRLANNTEFDQRKKTETTIRAFLEQDTTQAAATGVEDTLSRAGSRPVTVPGDASAGFPALTRESLNAAAAPASTESQRFR